MLERLPKEEVLLLHQSPSDFFKVKIKIFLCCVQSDSINFLSFGIHIPNVYYGCISLGNYLFASKWFNNYPDLWDFQSNSSQPPPSLDLMLEQAKQVSTIH